MFKMIIIDDEYIVRKGITETIDWPKYGITIVAEASNGQKGLELAKEIKPDLIITDIKMPVMDGIEFVNALKETDLDCEVIILSGYKDFEYSKETLEKGAFSYLLKPIDNNELIEKVLEAVDKVVEKRKLSRILTQVESDKPVLKKSIIEQLIYGEYNNIDDILKSINTYDLNISEKGYVLYAHLDNLDLYKKRDEVVEITDFFAESLEKSLNNHQIKNSKLFVNQGAFIMLIDLIREKELFEIIEQGLSQFELKYDHNVSIGLGEPYYKYQEIKDSHNQALKATQQKLFFGLNTIEFFHNDLERYKPLVYQAMDFVKNNYHKKITVKDVADSILTSESNLIHTFRDSVGKTFNECLTEYRISVAKKLLIQGNYLVYEVAEMVGYNNEKYFSQVFKKVTGLSPTEYIK